MKGIIGKYVIVKKDGDIALVKLRLYNNPTTYYMQAPLSTLDTLVSEKIEVDFIVTENLYGGSYVDFLYMGTIITARQTAETRSTSKLFLEDALSTEATIDFLELEQNKEYNELLYCVESSMHSSKKARWLEMKVMDCKRKVMIMRLFNPRSDTLIEGKYIRCIFTFNEFGLTVTRDSSIIEVDLDPVNINAQIGICEEYIRNQFKDDKLEEWLNESDFLKYLSEYVPDDQPLLIKGDMLIILSYQLYLLDKYKDLTNLLDLSEIKRYLVLSLAYVVNDQDETEDLVPYQNFLIFAKLKWKGSKIRYWLQGTDCPETQIAKLLQEQAFKIIEVERGVLNVKH